MTESTDSGNGRPTLDRQDWTNAPLEEPVASRKTLTRRLRAVEHALGDVGEIDVFEPAVEESPPTDRLDAVEARLLALERAVRAVGEHLVARDRSRREADGVESIQQAVEALSEFEFGTDASDDETAARVGDSRADSRTTSETPTEWLERVADGGVTPPPVE